MDMLQEFQRWTLHELVMASLAKNHSKEEDVRNFEARKVDHVRIF